MFYCIYWYKELKILPMGASVRVYSISFSISLAYGCTNPVLLSLKMLEALYSFGVR